MAAYKGREYLKNYLALKRCRVLLRYKYYEMKNGIKYFRTIIPSEFMWTAETLGWCGKAVDALADRLSFREFKHDDFDLNSIFAMNNGDILPDSAMLSALISSCCFVYISEDLDGYPRLQVIDGGNGTGVMDPITGLLTEGYAVISRDKNGNVDMASLYEVLTSEQIPYDLADQLADTLSFFVNFKANDRDWGELIEESKDIIIISTKAVRSNGGSGLIDMLLMSLYYYQQAHGEKQLSVFIDEIRTQNLSTKGPIAKILTESRKNRMSLNFATQFLPKSTQVREIMDNAAIHAFFPLDDRTAASAAKLLQVDSKELTLLETGECYIKGTFYNQNRQKAIPGILHGTTYRNFKKSKPESSSHSFIDVPCFDEKRCNFPPAKN